MLLRQSLRYQEGSSVRSDLSRRAERVHDRVDIEVIDRAAKCLRIHQVHNGGRTVGKMRGKGRTTACAGHGKVAAVAKGRNEFGADLTRGADNENVLQRNSARKPASSDAGGIAALLSQFG